MENKEYGQEYVMDKEDFHRLSTAKIKEMLEGEVPIEYLIWGQEDSRKSVRTATEIYLRKQRKILLERQRVDEMYAYENSFYLENKYHVAGVDEVGRGPIAGPVTVAAVILKPNCFIEGLNDSKKLTEAKREALYDIIMEEALSVSIVSYGPEAIDELNIYQATKKAMYEAVENLSVPAEAVLVDAMKLPNLRMPVVSLIKGDSKSASIAAASIVAKVTRDRYMKSLDEVYVGYGFGDHKGYCTEAHREAIENMGLTPEHRHSFEPVASTVNDLTKK